MVSPLGTQVNGTPVSAGELWSALYRGRVEHRRVGAPRRRFVAALDMVLVDLAEVDRLCARSALWSCRRPAPTWIRRADYLGDPEQPLDEAVRDLVAERCGRRPAGRVALLTQPRTWGWLFNPISCYFCYDADGSPGAMVAEVTNTPWHERHCYVVGPPGTYELTKALHVSPFLGMDLTYRLHYGALGPTFFLQMRAVGADGPELEVDLALTRRPAERRALNRLVVRPGRGTIGTSAAIYTQAARLWGEGAPRHRHPSARRRVVAPGPGSGP